MKDIKNTTIKNPCFGEIAYKITTSDMKCKSLTLLILIVNERSGQLKTLRVMNGSFQRAWRKLDAFHLCLVISLSNIFIVRLRRRREMSQQFIFLCSFFTQRVRMKIHCFLRCQEHQPCCWQSLIRTNGGSMWSNMMVSVRHMLHAKEGCVL